MAAATVVALAVTVGVVVQARSALDRVHATQQDALDRTRQALLAVAGPECAQAVGYARLASSRFAESETAKEARAAIAVCADYLAVQDATRSQPAGPAALAWAGLITRHPDSPIDAHLVATARQTLQDGDPRTVFDPPLCRRLGEFRTTGVADPEKAAGLDVDLLAHCALALRKAGDGARAEKALALLRHDLPLGEDEYDAGHAITVPGRATGVRPGTLQIVNATRLFDATVTIVGLTRPAVATVELPRCGARCGVVSTRGATTTCSAVSSWTFAGPPDRYLVFVRFQRGDKTSRSAHGRWTTSSDSGLRGCVVI